MYNMRAELQWLLRHAGIKRLHAGGKYQVHDKTRTPMTTLCLTQMTPGEQIEKRGNYCKKHKSKTKKQSVFFINRKNSYFLSSSRRDT